MKARKFLSIILALALCLTMLPLSASAAEGDTVVVDSITYTVLTDPSGSTPGTVELTSGRHASGDVEIPSTVEYNSNTYTVTSIGLEAFWGNATLKSIEIPDSVTEIGISAFQSCVALESIVIPNSVTSIGRQAFYNATALKSAVLPNNPGFTAIPAKMFEKCVTLQSIEIPDNVTRIGDAAFDSCLELSTVTLPDSLTSIGAKSFLRCFELTSISFPDGLTSIGDQAFYGCNTLGSVALPEGLTSIGNHAFHSCDLLKIEAFPDSLTSIGAYAFTGCTAVPEKWEIPTHSGHTTRASLSIGAGALENTTVHFSGGTMDVLGIVNTKGAVISGGSIRLTDAPEDFTPTNADGKPLYLNTATIQNFNGTKQTLRTVLGLLPGSDASTAVGNYGCDDMMTDREGKLYLWLPENEILQSCATLGSALLDIWQYTDGDSATQNDSFTTKAEASEIIFEPYLEPGTSFPITVEVLGYPNAQGFVYAQGASLNKDSTTLNVGEKEKTYTLMIDSDSNTAGVNPLPDSYSVKGLYLNETPPTDGNYAISDKFFNILSTTWTEGGVTYGGPTYQFTMPEETASITAVVQFTGTSAETDPKVTVNGVVMKMGEFLPSGSTSVTQMVPSGGYAWLYDDNGVTTLELNNASFTNGGVQLTATTTDPPLTIRLTGENTLAGAGSTDSAGIMDAYASVAGGGTDITFSGNGSLTATGNSVSADGVFSAGISGGGDITVESGVTIVASGGSATGTDGASYGIRAAGDVILAGNVTATSNDFGIMTTGGNINLAGGSITAYGGAKKALQPGVIPTGTVTCSVSPVKVGASKDTATIWDGSTALTEYQFVQAPADLTPPTVIINSISRTSDSAAAVKFTSNEAGEYYYAFADSGAEAPTIDTTGAGTACDTSVQTISLTGLTAGAKDIYIVVKDASGNMNEATATVIPAYVPPVVTRTVSFNANGGGSTMNSVTVNDGDTYTLPANSFTAPDGKQFKGWASSANGAVIEGAAITVSADITLYAVWEDIPAAQKYTVTASAGTGGSVSPTSAEAEAGGSVTFTITANSGYELDKVTLDETDVTSAVNNNQYTISSVQKAHVVAVTFKETGGGTGEGEGEGGGESGGGSPPVTPTPDAPVEPDPPVDDPVTPTQFADVPAEAYYYDAVAWAVENGLTEGTSETAFSPNAPCTRAQAVTFLWRAAGSPVIEGETGFDDVPADAYYAEAVKWAVQNGVTEGTSETMFSPNAPCTRAQIVTFLWRAAGSPMVEGDMGFTDVPADAYYAEAVKWAVQSGVTQGTSATTFSPDDNCTRGQIVTFLHRAYV